MVTRVSFGPSLQNTWTTACDTNLIRAPFFTYQWHALWYEVLAKDWQPYPLVIDETIIAPFARKANEIIFSGGEEISDYQDIIGSDKHKFDACKQIVDFLKGDGVTSIRLRNVPQSSATVSFFQSLANATVTQEDTTPIIRLPATWDEYIASLPYKNRHELRRKIRKIEREHKHIALINSHNPQQDIEILLDLMRKDKKKATFLTAEMTTFFQKLPEVFPEDISLLTLMMEDKPAAATLSFIANNGVLLYNSGFDKQCCPNAGWYLKAMTVKKAIEQERTQYNFLQGSERYKYNFGGTDFFVYSITVNL